MKKSVSLLIVFSIWNSLFAPISLAQNSNSFFRVIKIRPNKTVDEPEKEKKGLQFRVREGKPEAVPRTSPTPVSTSNLTSAETDSILKRLTPLPADEKSDFKIRSDSLPPPKSGTIINTKFPADENQNVPKSVDSKTLEVIRFSPSGNVGVTPEISITFSQPMIAVTSQDEAAQNVPVKLTPAVNGKWRWLGTRVLIFDAEKRLPMATKFTATIPAGTKSATGGTLTKDVSWEFSTTPPKVEAFSEDGATIKRDEKLFASFDQEISPAEVLAKISATTNGQKIPLRLLTESEMAKEIVEIKKEKPELLKRFIGFRAVELLPQDAVIYLSFDKGLPSAEGDLVTSEAQIFKFKTYGALKFVKALCNYGDESVAKCNPSNNPRLAFNNSIDEKNFDKSLIKIEPKIDTTFEIYGNGIVINGDLKPRTTYTVTISKNLKDDFGQTLGQDVTTKFTTGARDAKLEDMDYRDFLSVAPISNPQYTVYSTNYATLKVKIYSVKTEDYTAFLKFKDDTKNDYPAFGKLVFDKAIKIKSVRDEETFTDISLAPALKNGFGHAVLVVEPPVPSPSYAKIIKWLQVSNIGLDAFADREQLSVYTSNLQNGKPLGNVQLSLSNGANGVSGADGMANLKLLKAKPKERVFLTARQGNDSAVLIPENDYYYGESDEGTGWFLTSNGDQLRWFVFDDRKMYRPGEIVSIKGYLRKMTGGKMSGISELADSASGVSYVLKDARQVEITKGTAKLNAFGAFDLQLKIPENVNLGYQRLELKAISGLAEKEFIHNFQVQEFRRPEFEVSASVESSAPFFLGDSATILTEAKYFSGGGLANAETNWDISASPTNYTPPNRDDFTFGTFEPWWGYHGGSDWELRTSEQFKSRTDVEGNHRVALDFLKVNPARPYKIEARANIQDVNRQTFSGSTSLLVHPSKLYVGLRTPKTFVQAGENFKIETITTDIDGKAVAGAPVSVTAELKDWQQEKGEWKKVVVDTQKCELKSANDAVSCNFTAKQGGTYTITARVLDEKERPNESELTVWVGGERNKHSSDLTSQEAELIPNKKEYAPGEMAEILLNSGLYPAEGVMTLERGGIVKTERFTLDKSSTVLKIPIEEAYLPNIHVQVTLVGASILDEENPKSPKIPSYATGELNLEISTDSRKLNVTAEPVDKILQPAGQTKVNIAVTDKFGKAVANSEVALVAVDESILALTGYKIQNPLDIFYQQFEANTSNAHSWENILLNLDGFGFGRGNGGNGQGDSDEPPPAKPNAIYLSGDSPYVAASKTAANVATTANTAANTVAMEPKLPPSAHIDQVTNPATQGNRKEKPSEEPTDPLQLMQLRRNFAATAIFAASVKTDANGKATIDLKLPDNLTRYRITAVAVTKWKQFGLGESNVTAKQPLQIRPSAPRFLNFGDKAEIPVVLQNQTDAPMSVDVAIRSSNATLTDGNGKKVTVPANERAEIRFPVTAENAGIARFQIGATAGKFADAAEIEFPVYTPATTEAFATYGTTDQNDAIIQPISAPKDVYSEFGGLEITSSSTQLQELTDAFIYLQSYPFECSEQISSRILSVATLRDVLTAFNAKDMPSKAQIEAKMKSDIERLQKLQHKDGGWSFWRNDDESFPYLSVHVAHALARAKAKGYAVPKETLDKMQVYLTNIESHFPKWYSQEARWAITAYSLFVRELLGEKSPIPKARLMLLNVGLEKLSPESIGWILSVLANDKGSIAQVEEIKRHLLNRVTETADKANFVSKYSDGEYVLLSSDRRADGVILEALLRNSESEDQRSKIKDQSSNSLIPKIVRGLLATRTKGRWQSTQENVFLLLALDKYFQTFEKVSPNFVSKIWFGNAFAGEQNFFGRTTDSNFINVPMNYLQTQTGAQNLILDKQGEGRLYYRIGLKYAPKNLNLAAADYGFEVTRTYEAVDNAEDVKRNADGSWTIKAGARVRVKVQMANSAVRYHVALVDYLPAGFEIINSELANSSSTGDKPPSFWNWFDHQNLRDNRAEAFCTYLYSGVWEYKYVVRATTLGTFVTPPAKAEEMYAPETFGRSKTDFVRVE